MNQNQELIKERDPAKLAAMLRSGKHGPMNMETISLAVICGAPIFTVREQTDAEDALKKRMAGYKDSLKIREWIAAHGDDYKAAAKIMLRELDAREAKAAQAKTAMSWTRLGKDPVNSIFKIDKGFDRGHAEPYIHRDFSCDKPKERAEMAALLQQISGMTDERKTAFLKDHGLLKTLFSKWNGYTFNKDHCHKRLQDPDPRNRPLWCRISLNTAVFELKETKDGPRAMPVEIVFWRFDGKPDLDAGVITGGTGGYIPPAAPKEPKPAPDVWQTALKKAFAGDDALFARYSAYKYAINDGSIALTIPVFLSPFASGATLAENASQQADADLIDRGNLDLADFGGRKLIYEFDMIDPALAPKPNQVDVYRMILLESFEEGSPCRRLAEDFENDLSKNILETEEATYYVLPIRSGIRPNAYKAAKAKWEAKEGQPKLILVDKMPAL